MSPDSACAERADRETSSEVGISGLSEASPKAALDVKLASIRAHIDNIDSALVSLLAERFRVTQQVGLLKVIHQLPPDPVFAEKFLNFIIREVIQHHKAISEHHNGDPVVSTD